MLGLRVGMEPVGHGFQVAARPVAVLRAAVVLAAACGCSEHALNAHKAPDSGLADAALSTTDASVAGEVPTSGEVLTVTNDGSSDTVPVAYDGAVLDAPVVNGEAGLVGDIAPRDIVTDQAAAVDAITKDARVDAGGPLACSPSRPLGIQPLLELGRFDFDSMAAGDLNADGALDLVVAGSGVVAVLLGMGDGTFAAKQDAVIGEFSGPPVTLGDFNGDGNLDVLVGTRSKGLSVLLGAGDGRLVGSVYSPTQSSPSAVALGDLDGDGKLDAVAATGLKVSVLLGAGDGRLVAGADYPTGGDPVAVTLGDLDGDGTLDIVTANRCDQSHAACVVSASVLLGAGDGSFGGKTEFVVEGDPTRYTHSPQAVVLGDLNGDGRLDAVVGTAGWYYVMLGMGDGKLSAAQGGVGGFGPILLADFDGDGRLDLAELVDSNRVSVRLGTGDGSFGFGAPSTVIGPYLGSRGSIVQGDLNGDGKPDLAALTTNGTAGALLGTGDGGFSSVWPTLSYETGQTPSSIAFGDLNRDGKLDLVTANCDDATASVLLGIGDGAFAEHVDYRAGGGSCSVALGDLDGDGKLDLVTTNRDDSTASVLMGKGDGTFAVSVNYPTGADPYAVALGDLNGDGRVDLVTANAFSKTVSVLFGRGDGTLIARVDYPIEGDPTGFVAVDVNGDRRLDLVMADRESDTVGVMLGNGDGTFAAKVDYPTGHIPYTVAVGDLNGDGNPDMAIANYDGHYPVSVLLGRGDGTFAPRVDCLTGDTPYLVALGDVNGDGKTDLVTANYGGTVSILLGRGDGTFATASRYATPGPSSMALADLNGDGAVDIVTGTGVQVDVFLNMCPSTARMTGDDGQRLHDLAPPRARAAVP